ncbi:right-handed parallel beta-helix repeat-containing protein [Rhizobium sp. SL42]|uniref:right-handed parallel beta-helix repeat-containing protein n=1 Tax=Rhizobium sp. SL42 TaxID=2806346 RepID=UPI001F3EB148|nr:right-handed parallel beta-helix repeat-containing protein [Rhizobium sp. SL42]UJW74932.1 right-handed parallel beta-helix repeat-containing protein [Rhizobium sp. SL42]
MRRSASLLFAGLLASTAFGVNAENLDHAALARLTGQINQVTDHAASGDTSVESLLPLLTERLHGIAPSVLVDAPAFVTIEGKGGLHTIPVDFMLAQLRLQTGARFSADIGRALTDANAPALFIRGGTITLKELAATAATQFPGAIEQNGETWTANWPIVIWSDSGLVIEDSDRLELSTRAGAFVLNAGLLQVNNGSISGSPESNDGLPEFKPFIVTAMSGALQAKKAKFGNLGFPGSGSTSGISIIGAALLPAKMRSFFVESAFDRVSSVDLLDTHNVLIARNQFRDADGPAIAVKGVNSARILSNIVTGSRQAQGINIQNRSSDIEIAHNLVLGNRGSGIFLANGVRDIKVSANLLSGNGRGGISVVRGTCVRLIDNIVVANRQVGIKIRASDQLALSQNQLINNSGPGISVIEQGPKAALTIDGNQFIANRSGLHGGSASQVALSGNDFAGQSPILLDGEFASYVPQLLRISTADATAQPFIIHANEQSSARTDCQSGS